jgi:penicillin-binding protein 1B
VVKKQQARRSLLRWLFSPVKLAILAILLLILGSVFSFFYVKYSALIDARLRGDVVVRTTGIFAAPRTLGVGQATSLASVRSHLDSIGYVESTKDADSKRGRYLLKGNVIDIYTSGDAIINGVRAFPNIKIAFGPNGRGIEQITDLDTKRPLDNAQLEPEMMTAVSNEKQRQKQKLVSFKDLPKDYINAVTAIEDRQFFEHSGINLRGIARAMVRDVNEGELQQGGSSITQQLVKNFFLTPERTFKRKSQEVMISLVLETKLSKEQIFQLYANEVYMGQAGSYSINGVGEAASAYFNKDVVNLTLPECAFLAGIIRGPSLYSPYRDPERAKARRNQVLDSMVEAGTITRELGEQAKAVELRIVPKRSALNSDAPYFLDYLQQQMTSELASRDLAHQSYRVYSTIDMDLQRAADKAVNDTLAQLDGLFSKRKKNPLPPGTLQAALVAMNARTGEVLAMVGGRDYAQSQLNRAVEANRQPGSVFKPFVYAAALNSAYESSSDEVLSPASLFLDSPETFNYGRGQVYEPGNFGKKYSDKDVTLRYALVHSLNVVTVRIAEKVGYSKVARLAEKMGLPRPQVYPAMALGASEATPLEIAEAYTAFANGGSRTNARILRRITEASGQPVTETEPQSQLVLKPQVSWLMTNIMQDVLNRGTGSRARGMGFSANAAGKTGTSRDGWFAGYTPNLVCVVWVGFDDNSELGLEGSKSALPIWAAFMKQALALRPELGGSSFAKPDGIVDVEIDPTTGLLAGEKCPTRAAEYFIEGTEPEENCVGPHAGEHPESLVDPLAAPTPELPVEEGTQQERPRRAVRPPDKPAEEPKKRPDLPRNR